MKKLVGVIIALALGLAASGCGSSGSPASSEKTVQVFAAASLNKVFTELGGKFEASHPGVKVKFNFDGSSGLVDQLKGGAKADVFASADEKNMANAVDAKLTTGSQTVFARNVLTLVTAPGNPKKITGLDLACLELDATNFSIQGRVRLAQVSAAIIGDVQNKKWLHHPSLRAAVERVRQQLRNQAVTVQLAIDRARARAACATACPRSNSGSGSDSPIPTECI